MTFRNTVQSEMAKNSSSAAKAEFRPCCYSNA
jgi:hypothetical protein